MKNGWLLAAACVVLAGCAVKDEAVTSLNSPEMAASPESMAAPITSENTARTIANGGALKTGSAFPASTPPSNRGSYTDLGYWDASRENTRPYEKEEEEHAGQEGHGEHEQHGHADHEEEGAELVKTTPTETPKPEPHSEAPAEGSAHHEGH